MKVFPTFQEFINYIPNCVICQKQMSISLTGYLQNLSSIKKKWGRNSSRVHLKLEIDNGVLKSKDNDNLKLAINLSDYQIIEGKDLINGFVRSTTDIKKCCNTCVFKILCSDSRTYTPQKDSSFSPLKLQSEELSYTLVGGKRVQLHKRYAYPVDDKPIVCDIVYNGKRLSPVLLDFDKLTDLEQISRKIKTIITFQ